MQIGGRGRGSGLELERARAELTESNADHPSEEAEVERCSATGSAAKGENVPTVAYTGTRQFVPGETWVG